MWTLFAKIRKTHEETRVMQMKVSVAYHAIERLMTRFPYLAHKFKTPQQLSRYIVRMFKRGRLCGSRDLAEYRRKGNLVMVAKRTRDEKGGLTNRKVITVYKGKPGTRRRK